MVQHRKFMDLALDDEGLHTPDGVLDLTGITKAEVVRHWNRDASRGETYRSHSGGVGGALLGGAVAGPVGFIGGALLGSAIDRDGSSEPHIPRMVSATVTFESADLAYTTTVGRDRVEEAEAFVAAVKAGGGGTCSTFKTSVTAPTAVGVYELQLIKGVAPFTMITGDLDALMETSIRVPITVK